MRSFLIVHSLVLISLLAVKCSTAEGESALQDLQCHGPGVDTRERDTKSGEDQASQGCKCKKNVRGAQCDDCRKNSFLLRDDNPHGCLRCFCSGQRRTPCESAGRHWARQRATADTSDTNHGFSLVGQNLKVESSTPAVDEEGGFIYVDDLQEKLSLTYSGPLYWKVPEKFVGERLTYYGGHLEFNVTYDLARGNNRWVKKPFVILRGNGVTLYHRFRKSYRVNTHYSVLLKERSWYKYKSVKMADNEMNGAKNMKQKKRRRARRKDIMRVLSNLDYILILANFKRNPDVVRLHNLSIGNAVENGTSGYPANEVEICNCPPGYAGTSCQHCDVGYTRVVPADGRPFQCNPCNCNGNSDTCDSQTGKCKECRNGTTGDFCEESNQPCDERGSLNVLASSRSHCKCKARVHGSACHLCKLGHFNLDRENEMGCSKCWCSGVTSRCSSTTLQRFQVRIQPQSDIGVSFTYSSKHIFHRKVRSGVARFDLNRDSAFSDLVWSMPKEFTGNLLKSYGGTFNFTMMNYGFCRKPIATFPLVELRSTSDVSLQWKFSPPVKMNVLSSFSIDLVEDNFVYFGSRIERHAFLDVLSSLKSFFVYVPHCRDMTSIEIGNIMMDTAVPNSLIHTQPFAHAVEECQCPPQYSGLSCERCADGYVRNTTGRCVRSRSLKRNGGYTSRRRQTMNDI